MKKIHTTVAVLLLAWALGESGCVLDAKRVKGNGNETTETRAVGDFETLVVAGSMEVRLRQGPLEAARVTAESNIQPYITLERKEGKLVVGFRPHTSISTTRPVVVSLTAPAVTRLEALGSGRVAVEDTLQSVHDLSVRLAGSGDISLKMDAPALSADVIGSGSISVAGETRDLHLNILGSGDFKGSELKSEQARVRITGSGNASVYASVGLHTVILGSGNVYYQGDPTLESSRTGSGKVLPKAD